MVHKLAEFAVPVFARISGYYAYGCTKATIKKGLLRIFKIFALAFVLYTVYTIIGNGWKLNICEVTGEYFLATLVKAVVFCTVDYAFPLWYLIAMTETYVLWLIIRKSMNINRIICLMTLLFLLMIVTRIWCETMALPWYLKVNFLTCAMPWFLLGYYLKTPEKKLIDRFKDITIISIAVAGCIVALIPVLINTMIQFSFLGVVLYSISLFLMGIRHGDKSICCVMEYIGNKLSLNIYVFHVIVGGMLGLYATGYL